MSLHNKAIGRLFQRLGATYGSEWLRHLDGVPLSDVKTAWAHELAGFENRLEALAWALENLPERCPNIIAFRNLCLRAPDANLAALAPPVNPPKDLQAELDKLKVLRNKPMAFGATDPKAWAKRILIRVDAGEPVSHAQREFAQSAMRFERRSQDGA